LKAMLEHNRIILALTIIALIAIISAVLLLPPYLLQQSNSHITVNPSSNNWPMFHYDLNHTGYSTSVAPVTPNLLWNYTTDFIPPSNPTREGIPSSPIIADGYLYIGTEYGNVYCLNASSGERVWSYSTGATVNPSAAVAGGYVYVASRQ